MDDWILRLPWAVEHADKVEQLLEREWLVTNGIGGYASGTVAGCATRRYHVVLLAALKPPVGRMQIVAALDEIVSYAGENYELATHEWTSGAVAPQGFRQGRGGVAFRCFF